MRRDTRTERGSKCNHAEIHFVIVSITKQANIFGGESFLCQITCCLEGGNLMSYKSNAPLELLMRRVHKVNAGSLQKNSEFENM